MSFTMQKGTVKQMEKDRPAKVNYRGRNDP